MSNTNTYRPALYPLNPVPNAIMACKVSIAAVRSCPLGSSVRRSLSSPHLYCGRCCTT